MVKNETAADAASAAAKRLAKVGWFGVFWQVPDYPFETIPQQANIEVDEIA
jgi:hypothetical protein